jgi:hypothetical protein
MLPGGAGMLMRVDRKTGELVDCLQPFENDDPNRYVASPLTIDANGSVYYTVMSLDAADPWTKDVKEAFLVKADRAGRTWKASFSSLVPGAPAEGCVTTFAEQPLPWPPAPDAKPPAAPCGSQRPGLNTAPAVTEDGTVYAISRAHFNSAYGYLLAINPDLTHNVKAPFDMSWELLHDVGWTFPDADGDTFPDDEDCNVASDVRPTIILNGRETLVPNRGLGAGCTMTDTIVAAKAASTDHNSFLSAVATLTNGWRAAGLITTAQKAVIQVTAGKWR